MSEFGLCLSGFRFDRIIQHDIDARIDEINYRCINCHGNHSQCNKNKIPVQSAIE